MKYYRQYVDDGSQEQIVKETALTALSNYYDLTQDQIQSELEKVAGQKRLRTVFAIYWVEK